MYLRILKHVFLKSLIETLNENTNLFNKEHIKKKNHLILFNILMKKWYLDMVYKCKVTYLTPNNCQIN